MYSMVITDADGPPAVGRRVAITKDELNAALSTLRPTIVATVSNRANAQLQAGLRAAGLLADAAAVP